MDEFFERLKQRKLVQWAVAYLAASFALIQVLDIVAQRFGWPEQAIRFVIVALAIGFFVTLVLAWYHGERGAQRVTGTELLILALLLTIGGAIAWRLGPMTSGPEQQASALNSSADSKSIAVLPLFGGGDPKDEYLGDGISEEVLNALSKLPGLHVIGRASSFQFRGNNVDASKVGRALNVRNLLSGTVQRAGEDLRITVELVDTASGVQLWSQRYDRTFKNLFALEDDISSAVSKALAIKLGAAAGQPLVDVATTNPRAHELYLRAKQLGYLSDETSLNQSVALFNQALAEDPGYAAAWAGLARTYAFLSDGYRAPAELKPMMRAAAEKAVALDPDLADGLVWLGYILMADEHDFPAAAREIERGLALNPGSTDAHMILGLYWLEAEHDAAAARDEIQIAQRLDPLNSWNLYADMWAATAQKDFTAVLELAQHINRIDPDFYYLSDPLVYAYAVSGRWQQCIDRSVAAPPAAGNLPDFAAAICYARVGNTARAREILQQLETAAHTRYVDHSDIAAVHAALGDNDGAIAALEQAYRDRSQPLLNFWFYPWFKPLYGDPRYQALIDKIYPSLKSPATSTKP